MSLETFTGFIPSLVDSNPTNQDPKSQGAAHIRGVKKTLSVTFAGFTEPNVAVTVKASDINAACAAAGTNLVPSGAVMAFAMVTPPAAWLLCDGAAVSRTTYANLFAAIGTTFGPGDTTTTFNVPNLQGQFVRGFGGPDTGRVFGTNQAADNAPHNHSGTTVDNTHNHSVTGSAASAGEHTHTIYRGVAISNGSTGSNGGDNLPFTGTSSANGAHTHTITGTAANNTHNHAFTTSTTGAESRPINVALQYCIKV